MNMESMREKGEKKKRKERQYLKSIFLSSFMNKKLSFVLFIISC